MRKWIVDVEISIMARCVVSIQFYGRTHTRVLYAKRIPMSQTVGQLLVLRRRASENHKLG